MSQYDGAGQSTDPWVQPEYEQPAERPPSAAGSTALVVALVTVLVLVLCGGGGAALYLLGAKDHLPTASGPAAPSTHAAASPSASPSGTRSDDPNAILKGQCVVNNGSEEAPVLHVVGCAPGTFQVLARFDGTTDKTKCKTVAGSNYHYFYDTSPDTLDFVLCLKKL